MKISVFVLLMLFAGVAAKAQQTQIVEIVTSKKFKVSHFFSNEAYFVDVAHLKVGNVSNPTIKDYSLTDSKHYSLLSFKSVKSEVDGTNIGGAVGSANLFGMSISSTVSKNEDVLLLDEIQSAEISDAINQLFVIYRAQKLNGLRDFSVRTTTSVGLTLFNDGTYLGFEFNDRVFIILESDLISLYKVIAEAVQ
ncbi:MAG: hypothetical protein RIG68_03060 [Imperialibacter sp.]|uniref:hypothetical protein n=1 Tax=Imperialibacter sp. TaxID=2038411 RepID=UPI0032ECA537